MNEPSDWEIIENVRCVSCPYCGFVFSASCDTDGQCPNCVAGGYSATKRLAQHWETVAGDNLGRAGRQLRDALEADRAALRSDSPVSDPVSPDWDRGWKTGYDTAIREGAAIPEGAIPVEVEARAECDCCMAIHDAKHIEPGSYYLVKRRPEPDKETP